MDADDAPIAVDLGNGAERCVEARKTDQIVLVGYVADEQRQIERLALYVLPVDPEVQQATDVVFWLTGSLSAVSLYATEL